MLYNWLIKDAQGTAISMDTAYISIIIVQQVLTQGLIAVITVCYKKGVNTKGCLELDESLVSTRTLPTSDVRCDSDCIQLSAYRYGSYIIVL